MSRDSLEKFINETRLYDSSEGIHNHFFKTDNGVLLSCWKRIRARLGFKVMLGNFKLRGWSGTNPFYLCKCQKCKKLFINYPSGFGGNLDCQFCNPPKTVEQALKRLLTD